jgi:oxygen-independent coproporphyrinogen-3 oxidase
LEPEQLERLLTHIENQFCFKDLKEYTVEAGRPDSITKEKLEVLKKHGIGRISINPQTMQQKTLDVIGRKHTVEDIRNVYHMARKLGFANINMDLIAGLPGESAEDMEDTLRQIMELAPESLTVHALAMKRASRLTQEQKGKALDENEEAQIATTLSRMIELANDAATKMGLEAYYLYRQKNIAGNFENVGYAKVDKAGIYNILIMEEKQSIIAVGAGASTKLVWAKDRIERIENVKDIRNYIDRIDEMIERKKAGLYEYSHS